MALLLCTWSYLESSEERLDRWFDGDIATTERRVLLSEWLGESDEKLSSEVIQRVFKKTGCCLDMTGKENDRVDIDQVQTFEVPKLGDQKMKKLTESEIVEWEKRESDLRTSAVLESLV